MRIIFFGTPDFAVPSLEALIKSDHHIISVITQPDKKRGRGNKLSPPPVKVLSEEHSLNVLQPASIRDNPFIDTLRAAKPDVIIVVAYGRILPKDILDTPPGGCINLHASLLPKYRGSAPVQWAIMEGESETGVASMLMEESLDTGPLFLSKKIAITDEDTHESVSKKLSVAGAEVLMETLNLMEKGKLLPIEQSGEVTYARPINKEDCRIDWSKPALNIHNLIRALYPRPSAYAYFNGERVKILKSLCLEGSGEPGKVVRQNEDGLVISTTKGLLSILELQPANKKPMSYQAYLSGRIKGSGDFLNVQ